MSALALQGESIGFPEPANNFQTSPSYIFGDKEDAEGMSFLLTIAKSSIAQGEEVYNEPLIIADYDLRNGKTDSDRAGIRFRQQRFVARVVALRRILTPLSEEIDINCENADPTDRVRTIAGFGAHVLLETVKIKPPVEEVPDGTPVRHLYAVVPKRLFAPLGTVTRSTDSI